MKGGSAMQTAKAVSVSKVSAEMTREWGEALWTAPSLADREFQQRLESRALRGLILGRL